MIDNPLEHAHENIPHSASASHPARMPQAPGRLVRLIPHLGPLALFLVLSLEAAYPLWLSPARIEYRGDPMLNSWILAWDQQALLHHPLLLFQADVFWPHPTTLAYGEIMLTQALLTLPFRPFISHPAAIHNLSLIQGYFLSAAGAYLLGLFYFKRRAPAIVCGLGYGFAAYRIVQSAHLQLTHGEFLPLMVLGFELMLRERSARARWLLCLATLGQCLASWYWAVFSFWCVGPYMAVRLWQQRRGLTWRRLGGILAPPIAAAAILLPIAWPYLLLKQDNILFRPPGIAAPFAAHLADYLVPQSRSLLLGGLHGAMPNRERLVFPGLFLGAGLLAGALLALRGNAECGMRNAESRNQNESCVSSLKPPASGFFSASGLPLRLWVILTLFLLSLTFGAQAELATPFGQFTLTLPLGLLHGFPMMDQTRVPARWMLPALLGLALVAAEVWRRLAGAGFRGARVLAALAFVLLLAESMPRPSPCVGVIARRPEALAWLSAQPYPNPVLILPLEHNQLMLEAAWLRQPMINGSNGYFPPGHMRILRALVRDFPDPEANARLRRLGIRYVVINQQAIKEDGSPDWEPGRLALLRQAAAPVKVLDMGDYLIADLGPAASDIDQIMDEYTKLDRVINPEAYQAR